MRRQLPIRARLTLAFAVGLAVVLVALSLFVYARVGADLQAEVDAALRSRAEILGGELDSRGVPLPSIEPGLLEQDEAFAQVSDVHGRLLQSSSVVAGTPLIAPREIASLGSPVFFDRSVHGIDNVTRVLAVPIAGPHGRFVILVGSSLQDRRDELVQLAVALAVGCPIALLLVSWGAWWLAGAALRPVERMRRQASTVSASDPRERLSVPQTGDEIARLAITLNEMLDRTQQAMERERRLVDRASHELRTPLAIQRMDLDLALSEPMTVEELEGVLRSVSEENEHLAKLARDLLVMSRAHEGRLSIERTATSLRRLVDDARARNLAKAGEAGVDLRSAAPDVPARLDPAWIRQALDNLIDNAIRATPNGGTVEVSAGRENASIHLAVQDSGPGFSKEFLDHPFEPFARTAAMASSNGQGAGLGLAIVQSIAVAHGGTAFAENMELGGARVTVVFEG